MTIPPNKREAADIARLVALVLMDPDPRTPDHIESELAAARAVAGYVKRAKIGQDQPAPTSARGSRGGRGRGGRGRTETPELRESKEIVRLRSGGFCEIIHLGCTGRAVHVHHRRRRSQGGSDAPENLLDTCTNCHDLIHREVAWSFERGYLLHALPVATS